MTKTKAEFEIWFDHASGYEELVDQRYNASAWPQPRFDARQSARYFATNGVWTSQSVLIPPSQITRVYLKKARPQEEISNGS